MRGAEVAGEKAMLAARPGPSAGCASRGRGRPGAEETGPTCIGPGCWRARENGPAREERRQAEVWRSWAKLGLGSGPAKEKRRPGWAARGKRKLVCWVGFTSSFSSSISFPFLFLAQTNLIEFKQNLNSTTLCAQANK